MFNRAFVLMEYFGYLRRDPNTGQHRDFAGYNFWLEKLDRFNGNFQEAEMVKLSSSQWVSRSVPTLKIETSCPQASRRLAFPPAIC